MSKIQTVYIIENIKTKKVYVGSTTRSVNSRFNSHKQFLRRNAHSNYHLQNAWNKYGEKVFSFNILEEAVSDIIDIRERETFYIKRFRALDPKFGYNIRPDTKVFKLSKESRKRISIANKGRKHSKEAKQKISKAFSGVKNPNAKPVNQFSKGGKFIRKFDYIGDAVKFVSVNKQTIVDCCRGRCKTAGGYIWEYAVIADKFRNTGGRKTGYKMSLETKNKIRKPIAQYTIEGKLIKVFPSIKSAIEETKFKSINNALLGFCKTAGGYVWEYANVIKNLKKGDDL